MKKWEVLQEEALTWVEDSFHSHDEIAQIMDVAKGSVTYYFNVAKARKHLLDARQLWIGIHDAGYRVATPDEFLKESLGRVKEGKRKIEKATLINEAAPTDRMSPEIKRRFINYNDRQMIFAAMMRDGVNEMKRIAEPKIKMTR